MIIRKAKSTKATRDNKPLPIIQVALLGRVKDGVQVYPYGSHGSPKKANHCLVLQPGDDAGDPYVIPISEDGRPAELEETEYVCGNFVVGSIIKFFADGTIKVTSKKDLIEEVDGKQVTTVAGTLTETFGGTVKTTAPLWEINANVVLNGNLTMGTRADGGGTPEVHGTFNLATDSVVNSKGTVNHSGAMTNTGTVSGDGTIVSNGISLHGHKHSGVDSGSSTSGGPVA